MRYGEKSESFGSRALNCLYYKVYGTCIGCKFQKVGGILCWTKILWCSVTLVIKKKVKELIF